MVIFLKLSLAYIKGSRLIIFELVFIGGSTGDVGKCVTSKEPWVCFLLGRSGFEYC